METLGRYQLIRKLATGGMAEVFLASADGPGGFSKQLVVKRILPHFADNPQFVEMFLSEAKLAAQLNHPNVVQVFDFGETDGHYYLAMEYVDGVNLRTLNKLHRAQLGPIPPAACARIISQACEGLSYAHNFKDPVTKRPVNLVHRDISPDNLIISRHGSVKVLDFGIAKAETQVHKTNTGMLKGKMAYMPQEQLQREVLDQRVDVYALGVVLFELLAGSMPFDATSEVSIIQAVMKPDPLPPLSSLVPGTSPMLEQTVAKALAKSRNFRYADCKSLQNDLEAYVVESGEKWLSSDLSALVERVDTDETRGTPEQAALTSQDSRLSRSKSKQGPVVASAGNDSTFVAQSGERPKTGSGVSNTQLRAVAVEKPKGAPIVAIVIAFLLIALAGGASAYLVWGRNGAEPIVGPPPPVKVTEVTKPVPTPVAVEDAGGLAVTEATEDAGATPVAMVEPTGEKPTGEKPNGGHHNKPEHPAPPTGKGKGEVEVRVRPYAVLFVDGTRIGQTPLDEPLLLPPGKHSFRLVNEQYNKDVAVDFTVKAGKSVFKYNLME